MVTISELVIILHLLRINWIFEINICLKSTFSEWLKYLLIPQKCLNCNTENLFQLIKITKTPMSYAGPDAALGGCSDTQGLALYLIIFRLCITARKKSGPDVCSYECLFFCSLSVSWQLLTKTYCICKRVWSLFWWIRNKFLISSTLGPGLSYLLV